jgi:hypothetical protein
MGALCGIPSNKARPSSPVSNDRALAASSPLYAAAWLDGGTEATGTPRLSTPARRATPFSSPIRVPDSPVTLLSAAAIAGAHAVRVRRHAIAVRWPDESEWSVSAEFDPAAGSGRPWSSAASLAAEARTP